MPNHCSIEGCTTGYHATQNRPSEEKLASFHYPFSKPELLQKWIKFTNRKEWTPTASSVICEKHFHEDALSRGKQRVVLKWKWNPVPTICRTPCEKRPLTQPNIDSWRKPPKIRNIEADQFLDFQREDQILNLDDLKEKHCPPGFQISISEDTVTRQLSTKLVLTSISFPSFHKQSRSTKSSKSSYHPMVFLLLSPDGSE